MMFLGRKHLHINISSKDFLWDSRIKVRDQGAGFRVSSTRKFYMLFILSLLFFNIEVLLTLTNMMN